MHYQIVNQKILSKISLSLLLMAKPTRILKKWLMCSISSLSMFLTKSVLEYPEQEKSPLDYLKERNSHSFYMKPIIHTEIEDIISPFKISKSTGPFSVPVKLSKLLKPYISKLLAIIFNESITLGIFLTNLNVPKLSQSTEKVLPLIHLTIGPFHFSLFIVRF